MITEDYVSFETAKLLKKKGFDEACIYVYLHDGSEDIWDADKEDIACQKPTIQMAMKWLREKEWFICIIPLAFYCGEKVVKFGYNIWAGDNLEIDESNTPEFNSYEEAAEAAIKYCLENLV